MVFARLKLVKERLVGGDQLHTKVPDINVTEIVDSEGSDARDEEHHSYLKRLSPKLAFQFRGTLYHWMSPEPTPKERSAFFIRLRCGIGMLLALDEKGMSLHHEANLRKTWIPYSSIVKVSSPSWEQCRVFIKTKQQELILFARVGENHTLIEAIKHRMAAFKRLARAEDKTATAIEYLPPPPVFAITGRKMQYSEHKLDQPTPRTTPFTTPRQSLRDDSDDA